MPPGRTNMAKIGIIGAGTWGIALSVLLHDNGHKISVWSALPQEIKDLQEKHEHKNLPGVVLPEDMEFTADLGHAMDQKDLLVLAVPSIFTRSTAHAMNPFCKEGQIVVNVAKGIEESTLMTLSEIIEEELPMADVAVLSGPSHAEEVGRRIPTTCVTGAKSKKTAEYIQTIFMSPVFRVYTSPDILGIELGGALKNVIALAAGIAAASRECHNIGILVLGICLKCRCDTGNNRNDCTESEKDQRCIFHNNPDNASYGIMFHVFTFYCYCTTHYFAAPFFIFSCFLICLITCFSAFSRAFFAL